jgi:integrase
LTVERLRHWRDGLVKAPKRFRSGKASTQARIVLVSPSDKEGMRRRRDTANRILTSAKAALNWAFNNRLVPDDTAWRFVKPFKNVGASRIRFLNAEEQLKLLEEARGPLLHLIAAALMTGARASELSRLRVCDFDHRNGSIFIAESKSGKSRHIPLTAGAAQLFSDLSSGRLNDAFLLPRENGIPWNRTYNRSFRVAAKAAGLFGVTFHGLRHSFASAMVREGAPLIVVAEVLGHADTRMVTKHYAHLAPSFVSQTVRQTAPDLAIRI